MSRFGPDAERKAFHDALYRIQADIEAAATWLKENGGVHKDKRLQQLREAYERVSAMTSTAPF